MAISPIVLQGQVSRAQDFSTIKHNEDSKVVVDQNNFHNKFNKAVDNRLNQVHHSDNAENGEKRYDAKEKGNGQYSGDGGKNQKKDSEEEKTDGKVTVKNISRFDVKI